MNPTDDPRHNLLLASLSPGEWLRWQPQLEMVNLSRGEMLHESGESPAFACFPTSGIVSLLYVLNNGTSTETSVIGREGMVGLSLFMGGGSTPARAVVQTAGAGYRMRADVFRDEFERAGPATKLMLRYAHALMTQLIQTAVCNRHHSLDQQLCRWLLLCLDRMSGDEILMTHELIANLLGVRREGVTHAARKLQSAGLVRYMRGRITVLDRPRLEERACECYRVVKKEYDRLAQDAAPV